MFKAPFFIEGIKNIFKKPITEEGSIEKVKAADNYRGRLSFNEDACKSLLLLLQLSLHITYLYVQDQSI